MSDTPRAIVGILRDPQGNVLANRSLTWFRARRQVQGQGGSAIVDELFSAPTNGSGSPNVSVVPGEYLVRIRLQDEDRYFPVGIPEGEGPYNIVDGIDTAAPILTPPLVAEAQGYRDAAQLAALAAGESEAAAALSAAQAGRWGVYADTATGLAATENGDYFSVYDAGEEVLQFYENIAGTAVEVASIRAVEDFDSDEIANASSVGGGNVSDALDWLSANKAPGILPSDGILGRWQGPGGGPDIAGPVTQIKLAPALRFRTDEDHTIDLDFAPQADAEAGSATDKALNALRVLQAINARVPAIIDDLVDGVIAGNAFTTASTVDIPLGGAWREIDLVIYITAASVNDLGVDAQFTRNGFSSVLSGASDYRWGLATAVYGVTQATVAGATDSKMRLINQGGNNGLNTAPSCRLHLTIPAYADGATAKRLEGGAAYRNGLANLQRNYGLDGLLTASDQVSAVNGLRIFPTSGTITGRYEVIGRR